MSELRKVFGIISYFPDPDTPYHAFVRKQRSNRCTELLLQLSSLWPTIDIIIIAQNWREYKLPIISNKITVFDNYSKLGILQARNILRQKFLESTYDYLVMLDDDVIIKCDDPDVFMREIDNHPDGMGYFVRTDHATQLAAISKYVYNRVSLPNIDAEAEQGFPETIFLADCKAKFPDRTFIFPKDCVQDLSAKSKYAREFPSTWLGEHKYDIDFMANVTASLIYSAAHTEAQYKDSDVGIDIVIPYVDSSDPVWTAEYARASGRADPQSNRYRSWDTLKYLFRGIENYMPFIHNVILILSQESQIPDWLDTGSVRIVYHQDFIPAEHLPTYNSCTIESYLFNITKLSDHILYFNDDIFPINLMKPTDFFVGDKPLLHFYKHLNYSKNQTFYCQCRAGADMVANLLHIDNYGGGELFVPDHSAMPMLRTTLATIGNQCESEISKTISRFRESQNINQYIYHYYQYYTGDYIDDVCPYLYMELSDDTSNIEFALFHLQEIRLICLNDMGDISDYDRVKAELLELFDRKFPKKSRYEL